MTPPDQWTAEERDYHAVWTDWCEQTGREDFTTLIERCITENVAPITAPRVILADEAQDFTALEFTLLAQWAQGTDSTVMVGDSQQAIYWFRGADPERLEQVPVARGESLTHSYRCPRAVAAAAQHWAAQLPGERVTWTARDHDGHVTEAPYALRDTDDLIAGALAAGEGSTMILAACRYMLTPLCHELRARGIPFANRWATSEAQWNPLDGPGPRALLALLRPVLPGDAGRMWTWGDLYALTEPMQAAALQRGAKASIKEHCREDQFGVTHAREEVPVSTLFTLLGDAATRLLDIDRDARGTVAWWRSSLLARAQRSADYAARVWARGGIDHLRPAWDPLHKPAGLTVGTIHSTKGAEAAHVLLSPEISKTAYYEGWHGSDPRAKDALRRMAYVGMTRASESLTILEPGCPEALPLDECLAVTA